jgi:hypothetical protein
MPSYRIPGEQTRLRFRIYRTVGLSGESRDMLRLRDAVG